MPWVVELRNHSDRQSCCIVHYLFHHLTGVSVIFCECSTKGQVWEGFGVHSETIIIYDMPVEHIEFAEGESIKHSFDSIDGKEVARGVKHKPSIRIARRIVDREGQMRHQHRGIVQMDQLGESRETTDDA